MNKSESIIELAIALVAAQRVMLPAKKTSKNSHLSSSYADLESVWETCREPLASNGLSVIQLLGTREGAGGILIETLLMHISGQWISSEFAMPIANTKNDAWAIGSAISYGRRYALMAILSIATHEDDDGVKAGGDLKHDPKPRNIPAPFESFLEERDVLRNSTTLKDLRCNFTKFPPGIRLELKDFKDSLKAKFNDDVPQ